MNPAKWQPTTWFALAVAAAALFGALIIWVFGEENFLVELAAGFGASLLAFAAALSWERHRELLEVRAEEERRRTDETKEMRRREKETKDEIKRLLESLSNEIEKNGPVLENLLRELEGLTDHSDDFVPVLPVLFSGAWVANAPRLAQILPYPGLLSELANFYTVIDELRFRVRYRAEARTDELDGGIRALARTAVAELEKLRNGVENVAADPILGVLKLERDIPVPTPLRFR